MDSGQTHSPILTHENGKLQRQQTELQCLLQTNRKLWTDLHLNPAFDLLLKMKQKQRNAAKKPLGYKAQAPQHIKYLLTPVCIYTSLNQLPQGAHNTASKCFS